MKIIHLTPAKRETKIISISINNQVAETIGSFKLLDFVFVSSVHCLPFPRSLEISRVVQLRGTITKLLSNLETAGFSFVLCSARHAKSTSDITTPTRRASRALKREIVEPRLWRAFTTTSRGIERARFVNRGQRTKWTVVEWSARFHVKSRRSVFAGCSRRAGKKGGDSRVVGKKKEKREEKK